MNRSCDPLGHKVFLALATGPLGHTSTRPFPAVRCGFSLDMSDRGDDISDLKKEK
jgi:hypothetical protein